jgi:DNA-directed DNA polymerase III PolC
MSQKKTELISASDFLAGLSDKERRTYDELTDFMLYKVEYGWLRKFAGKIPDEQVYLDRIAFECKEIYRLGFVKYVMIVWDVCQFARKNGIPFNARGSANASLALYLLDITSLNPMVAGPGAAPLLFARFISPNRIDYPDIDLDFADVRRSEIKEYLNNKYGNDCVADIATFTKMKGKQCFRDVCRVFRVPPPEVNKMTPLIYSRAKGDEDADFCIKDTFDQIPSCQKFKVRYPEVVEQAIKLEGQIRAQGVHPSGVVVSDRQLVNDIPLTIKRDGTKVAGFGMKDVEERGLLKLDILGLRTLRVLADTIELVNQRHDFKTCECKGCQELRDLSLVEFKPPRLDVWMENIQYDDDEVIKHIFQEGNTLGIFQFETPLFRKLVKRAVPQNVIDLGDINAIARPGPMRSGILQEWLDRRKNKSEIPSINKAYDKATAATMGLMIYQEQIMAIAHYMGGMSWVQTEKLRKTISKSVGKETMEGFRVEFIAGAITNGLSEKAAKIIFDQIIEFGAYSFNAAHSASYAFFAYRSAWLKTYYPNEFLLCEINSLRDKPDKMRNVIQESRRMGMEILLPHINRSNIDFRIEPNGMRVGFQSIKGIGPEAAKELISKQPYTDWNDFLTRITRRKVNSNVIRALVKAGAFEPMFPNSKPLLEHLESILKYPKAMASLEALEEARGESTWGEREYIEMQMTVLQVPPKKSLLTFYGDVYEAVERNFKITDIRDLGTDGEPGFFILKGQAYGIEHGYKDKGRKTGDVDSEEEEWHGNAKMNLDDGTDFIQGFFDPEAYERYKHFFNEELTEEAPVLIKAKKSGNTDYINIYEITLLSDFQKRLANGDQLERLEEFLINPPLQKYEYLKQSYNLLDVAEVIQQLDEGDYTPDHQYRMLGYVDRIYEHTASNGKMAFITISNFEESIDVLVWAGAWGYFKRDIKEGIAVAVKARKLPPRNASERPKLQIDMEKSDRLMPASMLS